ncbi:MAG: type I-E CRISPR-associated protein Cas6/Cse3/CasE, partial [Pirellulaceae bacterium]|nr:type I-E CRISPR-associated protein Cas6/Cse3/CasE [Pirellulaceae bacterium]
TATLEAPATTGTLHLTQILVPYEDAIRLLRIRDTYDWHQKVWLAFGGGDGQPRDFLIRVDRKEDAFRVLILSRSIPKKPDWCPTDCFGTKPIPDNFFAHPCYRFSLLANPTRKVRSNKAGERTKNGRRLAITKREDLIAWLQRKSDGGGFTVDAESLRTIPRGREFFHKDGKSHGAHTAVEFQGELTVTDPAQFRATVAAGIGSAKAFGFGLLVLAPINPRSTFRILHEDQSRTR